MSRLEDGWFQAAPTYTIGGNLDPGSSLHCCTLPGKLLVGTDVGRLQNPQLSLTGVEPTSNEGQIRQQEARRFESVVSSFRAHHDRESFVENDGEDLGKPNHVCVARHHSVEA